MPHRPDYERSDRHDSDPDRSTQHRPQDEPTRNLSDASDVRPANESNAPDQADRAGDETTPWSPAEGSVSETVPPPSLPESVGFAVPRPRPTSTFEDSLPRAGQTIEDFELLQELGRGAMGVVFLARQISLDRRVALKISKNIGDEAQTMASLEHRHIVQVFSEAVTAEGQQRLLCMQFVPGVTLEKVIQKLRAHSATPMNGRRFIDIVEDAQRGPALLDPEALHDRLLLSDSNREEVVCRLGIWLAEALEYAHRRGVLHRDIKPANILVDPYGHPRLADFSLSSRQVEHEASRAALFGGTLNYMAPEHLRAFLQEIDQEEVDERSDIYALGLVLFELLTLHLPNVERDPDDSIQQHVRRLMEFRRQPPPSLRAYVPEASSALERTLGRSLDPDPDGRYASAAELADALRGCLQLLETEKSLPSKGRVLRWCERWPLPAIIALTLSPHLAGSVLNISYNGWIVARLNETQQATFQWLVLVYNLIVYPVCVFAVVRLIVLTALRYRRVLQQRTDEPDIDFALARRRALRGPRWAALWASVGWFPGVVFFPLGLHLLSPPVMWEQAAHFFMSITLSGLIALTYSVVGLQLIAVRLYYPQLWDTAAELHATARRELRPARRLNWLSQILAGFIPLLGAALLVLVNKEEMTVNEYRIYQALTLWLIFLGFGGFQLALTVGGCLSKTIDALSGRSE